MVISKNSEILFLYDAKLCNPNGDPDEENKPRMDYETGRNLVSDVRLKRYLRDFWLIKDESYWRKYGLEKQDIWIKRIEQDGQEQTVSAKQRIDLLAKEFGVENAKNAVKNKEFVSWLLNKLIDVRLFGATMPIGSGSGAGDSLTFTGPVQFTWGYSLNKVDILPSSTISSTFAGRESGEKGQYGTFGKDWRVKYSFIGFYGVISAWRARKTLLSENDVKVFDESLINAIPIIGSTRSKIGQTPRLYIRIEYKDDQTFWGDMRTRLKLQNKEGIEGIEDVKLEFSSLFEIIQANQDSINQIVTFSHPDFKDGVKFINELKEHLKDQVKEL